MAKVAFLGLGVMGFPMAGHLVKKGGHDVTVYNRSEAKAKQWVETNPETYRDLARRHAAGARPIAGPADR